MQNNLHSSIIQFPGRRRRREDREPCGEQVVWEELKWPNNSHLQRERESKRERERERLCSLQFASSGDSGKEVRERTD